MGAVKSNDVEKMTALLGKHKSSLIDLISDFKISQSNLTPYTGTSDQDIESQLVNLIDSLCHVSQKSRAFVESLPKIYFFTWPGDLRFQSVVYAYDILNSRALDPIKLPDKIKLDLADTISIQSKDSLLVFNWDQIYDVGQNSARSQT